MKAAYSIERGNMPDFLLYLFPADIGLIRCVDERQAEDNTNGVEIPGGIYGIIDAVRTLTGCTEDEAWERAKQAGIPIGGHIDEKHGPKGCGYARLVEEDPKSVLAPQSVKAESRLGRIREADGQVLTLLGDHHPTHAVINHRENFSLDPDKAAADGLGIFNFDKWAAREYGKRLGFDGDAFADHLENVYRHTVTKLTGLVQFEEIR